MGPWTRALWASRAASNTRPSTPHRSKEIDALCRRVAARDGLYATHTRDRGRLVVEGTAEGIADGPRNRRPDAGLAHPRAARIGAARCQRPDRRAARGGGRRRPADRLGRSHASFRDHQPQHCHPPAVPGDGGLADQLLRFQGPDALRVGPADDTVIAAFGRAGWDRTFVLETGARHAELARASVAEVAAVTGLDPVEVLLDGPARRRRRRRRPPADGDGHDLHRVRHRRGDRDIALRGGLRRDDDEPCGSLLRPDAPGAFTWAAWFLRRMVRGVGGVLPAGRGDPADHLAAGGPGRPRRSGPATARRPGRTSSSSTRPTIREPANPIRPGGARDGRRSCVW